jgi:TolB-like protein/Tfp pilus assembly protein PilF
MFADIVGYTALMQDNESNARRVCRRFRAVLKDVLPPHAGDVVQFYGDGALVVFHSAKEAVLAAIAAQRAARNVPPVVPLRIGIHIGDVVRDESGVYGDGVNIAARVESMALPGAILLSERLKIELDNHPDIRTVRLGEYELKNVRRPIVIYAVNDEDLVVPSPGQIHGDSKASERKTVAVMPFSFVGPEDASYLADGLVQEIVNGLTSVEGLSTIARSTCLAVQSEDPDPMRIGRRLKVRNIVEGSVRGAGERVRVSVQLVNTTDGSQVWSEKYDRRLDDIFEVQDEIAQLVVNGLKLNFDLGQRDQPIIESATDNVEAYKLYLKGLHHWNTRTPESGRKAVGLLEGALELDPAFPSAECTLSQCYAYLGSCGVLPPREAYARALDHAMNAIERNPRMPEAHLALAVLKFYHLWDWRGTEASLKKAEALKLDSTEFHQVYGTYLAAIGRPEAGLPRLQRAVELDPLSVPTIYVLAALHFFCGEYERALGLYEEIVELNPAFRGAYQLKGFALTMLGRLEEALTVLEDYHARVNHPLKGLTCLTLTHHLLGHDEEAADCVRRMYQRLEDEGSVGAEVDVALVAAGLGQFDKALEHLDSVYDQRYSIACTGILWILRCPFFAEFWEYPGYKRFLERMGLDR